MADCPQKALIDFEPVLSTLCPRWTPLKITGLVINWLRQHFSTAANLFEPGLENRLWTEEDSTGILIESVGRWRPTTTEKRPALLVKRHTFNPIQRGIGNRLMGGESEYAGRQFFSLLLNITVTIFCIASESGEAEALGSEVWHEIRGFAIKFTEELGFVRVNLGPIGEVSNLEESKDHFVVPVSCQFHFWDSWEVTNENSAVLRKILSTINLETT